MSKVLKTERILAIETSCDETAIALVEATPSSSRGGRPQFKILADVVASQIETHRPYGGVVPSLAKREHLKNLPIVLEKITGLRKGLKFKSLAKAIDLIAVTIGPGLEPCLWTGLNFAKDLAKKLKVPLVGVNHLEGHLFSNWLPPKNQGKGSQGGYSNVLKNLRISENKISFPAIVLLVSGGHTMLVLMRSITKWSVLGETRDDAVGEAFDKVAKMLGLPYPGGPEVERLARNFDISKYQHIEFPRPMIHDKSYDFSFSGLKTAVLYYLRDLSSQATPPSWRGGETDEVPTASRILDGEAIGTISVTSKAEKIATPSPFDENQKSWARDDNKTPLAQNDSIKICASFQKAAIDVLVHKTMRATKEFKAESILLCGGVACNKALQKELKNKTKEKPFDKLRVEFHVPNMKFNTDNAVMIAIAAHLGKKYPTAKPLPNLNL